MSPQNQMPIDEVFELTVASMASNSKYLRVMAMGRSPEEIAKLSKAALKIDRLVAGLERLTQD